MRRLHADVNADAFHRVSSRITHAYREDLALGTIVSSCDEVDDAWHIRLPNCEDDFYVKSRSDPTVSEQQWQEWAEEDRANGLEVAA